MTILPESSRASVSWLATLTGIRGLLSPGLHNRSSHSDMLYYQSLPRPWILLFLDSSRRGGLPVHRSNTFMGFGCRRAAREVGLGPGLALLTLPPESPPGFPVAPLFLLWYWDGPFSIDPDHSLSLPPLSPDGFPIGLSESPHQQGWFVQHNALPQPVGSECNGPIQLFTPLWGLPL